MLLLLLRLLLLPLQVQGAALQNALPHGHCISPLATFALSSSDATPASVG